MQAQFIHKGTTIDYTPGTAIKAGAVVVLGVLVGIAERAIPANTQGAITIDGVFQMAEKNEVINEGVMGYWDADGNPKSGDAGDPGSGAMTATKADGVFAGVKVPAGDYAVPDGFGLYKLVQSEDTTDTDTNTND